jgi:hypothetical protein
MTQHDRLRHRKRLVAHGDIGVANPGGDNSNEDLVVSWFRQVNVFERLRRVRRARDGCSYLHGDLRLK